MKKIKEIFHAEELEMFQCFREEDYTGAIEECIKLLKQQEHKSYHSLYETIIHACIELNKNKRI